MSVSGSWEPMRHPTKPGMVEVLPTPDDNAELRPGWEVWLTYDLVDLGEWLVGYQVSKVEEHVARDGRFKVIAYTYDPQARTVTFKCVVQEPPAQVQLAAVGGYTLAVLVGLILGGITFYAFVYPGSRKTIVWGYVETVEAIKANPNLTEEEKQAALDAANREMEKDLAQRPAVTELAGAGALIALAVIAWAVLGSR